MSVSSTSAAAQVERAPTEVEDAKRAVAALERAVAALETEQNELTRFVVALGDIEDSGEQTIDVKLKRELRSCGILSVGSVDDALAELTERLTSVDKRLVAAQEMQRSVSTFTQPEARLTAEGLLESLPERWQWRSRKVKAHESDARLLDRDEDFRAVEKYLAAVQEKSSLYVEQQGWGEVKTAVFLAYAVKGGGKTRFLKKIANEHALTNEHGGAGIFVSYRENATVHEATRGDELWCFAVHLLRHHGVPDDAAKRVASLDAALAFMRKSMQMKDLAPLTICVDEIAVLDDQKVEGYNPALETLRALMRYQDSITNAENAASGRVYFIFSSLIASFANIWATGSSRPIMDRLIVKHGLKNLCEESAFALLSDASKQLVKTVPGVRMAFKSLAGHPRAVVEGFNSSVVAGTDVETDTFLAQLLSEIMEKCKFDQAPGTEDIMAQMEAAVSKWIAKDGDADIARVSRLRGWLQKSSTGEEVLMPLVLRHFSEAEELPQSVLRKELQKLYHADLAVGPGTEKSVEELLWQFEIVQKLCQTGVLLENFFDGGALGLPGLGNTRLHMHTPCVRHVTRFPSTPAGDTAGSAGVAPEGDNSDLDDDVLPEGATARLLLRGGTVVSKRQNENGVECYLSPFFKRAFDPLRPYEYADLLVAMVQVKYSSSRSPDWRTYTGLVNKSRAKAFLKANQIAHFTVFYTMSDNVPRLAEMDMNTVYYNRDGMKTFLEKLGPLRFHEEKSVELEGMCRRGSAH